MGFYDSKGYWRNDGEGFYDGKGYFRSPGDCFYDSKGFFRNPGDGFYDSHGNWVNPGGVFYDSKGYLRSVSISVSSSTDAGESIVIVIALILFLPLFLFGLIMTSLVEWLTTHFYFFLIIYCVVDSVICFVVTKQKKHQGIKYIFSFAGNFLCILSYVYIAVLYAVPYIKINGVNFESIFELSIVSIFGIGGIAVVQFFNYYHEKAILEFLCGVLYFFIVINFLTNGISTIANIASIYNLENDGLFNYIFGFAL